MMPDLSPEMFRVYQLFEDQGVSGRTNGHNHSPTQKRWQCRPRVFYAILTLTCTSDRDHPNLAFKSSHVGISSQ